jgi:protein-S-isoprenylcysteine O-methyltransferase Ste14
MTITLAPALMLAGFGAEYQAYMDRTGRLLPKLF